VCCVYFSIKNLTETTCKFSLCLCIKLHCVAEFDLEKLRDESLLLVVTSTYGNGEAPDNGASLKNYLEELKDNPYDKNLNNLKYL
jgi:sulfite reductase alpha subunit-like flavoprotein